MNNKSCVNTLQLLRRLALNVYGVIDIIDNRNIDEMIKLLSEIPSLQEKLKEYENLEQQGLLIKLPCKIGDDVYFIPGNTNYGLNLSGGHPENNRVYHQKVVKITLTKRGWCLQLDKNSGYGAGRTLMDKAFKNTWFLSLEEAKQALKRREDIPH
jgi:hypothetical protein